MIASQLDAFAQGPFQGPQDIDLGDGWTLVGWTAADTEAGAAAEILGADIVTGFGGQTQAFQRFDVNAPSILNTLSVVMQGYGVWGFRDSAGRVTIPAPDGARSGPSASFKAIAARGSIRVGIFGVTILPFADPPNESGFELELAREIVDRLFGDIRVEWVPSSGGERFGFPQDGTIDLLVRATSHTVSREQEAAPTSNYFLDGLVVTVRTDSGLTSLADLDGNTIAAAADPTLRTQLVNAFEEAGVVVEFRDGDAANPPIDLLDSGAVDGMAESYIGEAIRGRDDLTTITVALDDPWAVWAAEADFRAEVNAVLFGLMNDGTWDEPFTRWFRFAAPWTIEEMLAVPPLDS